MIRLLGASVVAGAATPAHAHGALSGGGGFYAGAMHPFLAWEHLLLLVGFGLILGRNPVPDRRPVGWLGLGLTAGLGLGAAGISWSGAPVGVLIAGLATGVCLSAAAPAPRPILEAAAVAIGLAIGLDTGAPGQSTADATWLAYGGVFVAVFLIVLNAMALATVAARPPFAIGLRVVGSWIAAASLMVLAVEFRRLGAA